MDTYTPPTFPTPGGAIFVDAAKGSDANAGTMAAPFKTIAAAVAASKAGGTIALRAGVHHTDMVSLTTKHNGLTIQNYNGEAATVSGGVPINVKPSDWKRDPRMKGRWVVDLKGSGITEITGMRIDGNRSIRAKYPNGNMELSGNWLAGAGASMGGGDYTKGWIPLKNVCVRGVGVPACMRVWVRRACRARVHGRTGARVHRRAGGGHVAAALAGGHCDGHNGRARR